MESFSAETNSTELFSQPLDNPIMILSAVLFSLTFLLGLPGNGLVLWVAGLKMQRTVNMVWFLHLTVADFLCCLSLPFTLAYLVLRGYWPYGWFLCKLIPSVVILNMFASVFLLTAISLDRCLMVFKPIWCQNHRTVKTALTICGCIWVMAFIMCIPVFVYREKFTVHGREMCGYNFDLDYSDFPFDLDFLENRSFYNSIVQLPGDMNNGLDPSSIQTDEQLWTATMDLHSQTFQGPSRDSFPTRLSRQPPRDNLFKPTSVVPPAVPSGFPTEEHGTNPLDHSGAFLPTDLELLPSTSGHSLYVPDLSQDLQYDYLDQYTYVSQPLLVITFTRLVIGFLMPFVVMVTCYTFIACRMKRGRFAKSGSKTIRLAMVVVTVFFVCWAPYHVVRVLVLLFFDSKTPFGKALIAWDYLSIALASANSCFNPFLYALLGKDFRKKARQSLQGILEVAFSEELTHSTSCTRNKAFSEKNSINTTV